MFTILGSEFLVLNAEPLNPLIKIRYIPLLIPNIPLLQYSIIPAGIYGKFHPSGAAPKPGSLYPDSLLRYQ
jgi:hypothetical protein